MICDVKII